MKKLLLFLLPLAFLVACNDSDPDDVLKIEGCTNPSAINYNPYANFDDGSCVTVQQKAGAFAVNYTATWCGPCGSWGAPLIHDIEAAGDNVVAITAHASNDPMHVPALYSSFASSRPTGGGIPSFWVGDVKDGGVAGAQALLAQTPPAGMEFVATKNGSTMSVDVDVVFFEAVQGDYYLSVYILEDGIDGSATAGAYKQNGVSNPDTYEHDFVLRTAATPNDAYGEKIASGSIASGAAFDKSYEIPLDASWDDVYVAVCLWRYDASTSMYKFVNALKKR